MYRDYDIEDLPQKWDEDHLRTEIEHAEEMVAERMRWLIEAKERLQYLTVIAWNTEIEIRKTKDYPTGKVEFDVHARKYPREVPKTQENTVSLRSKDPQPHYYASLRFVGNDKRPDAIRYTRELLDMFPGSALAVRQFDLTKSEESILKPGIVIP